MKVLAIDTSNLVMGVAIVDGEKVVGEIVTNLKKNHSLRLMPAISELMKEVEVKPEQLDRIVVANGPGSYTGVRIGVTTAKSMAWALNIPIVGVSSLEVLSQNGKLFDGVISPLFDARRGRVYTGLYTCSAGEITAIEPDRVELLTDWLAKIKKRSEKVLFLGNDLDLHQELIHEQLKEQAVFVNAASQNPRPSELALLGITRKITENIHTFVPEYHQLAEAEAKWLASREGMEQKND